MKKTKIKLSDKNKPKKKKRVSKVTQVDVNVENLISGIDLFGDVSETDFAKATELEVENWEELMMVSCHVCKNKYDMTKVSSSEGSPICPKCGCH